ncbi:hypothetical protein MLGJGCBP_02582 [Rhodococcus sp. T7]|nr:hypothetical protein MLGJGCBP_09275 [Rhodococcus sp. T7]KAF0964278.1 hypothetical protein MLGJGCBP_02582 [Rhodococcus sp. T7]
MFQYFVSAVADTRSALSLMLSLTTANACLVSRDVVAGGTSFGTAPTNFCANNATPAAGFARPTVASWAMFAGVSTSFTTVLTALNPMVPIFITAEIVSCAVGIGVRGSDAIATRSDSDFCGSIDKFASVVPLMSSLITGTAVLIVVNASASLIDVNDRIGSPADNSL